MLGQTRRAIDHLREAGLRRDEFRVHAPRTRHGRNVGYGKVQITLLCSTERAIAVSPELAKHFEVVHIIDADRVRHVSVHDSLPCLRKEVLG